MVDALGCVYAHPFAKVGIFNISSDKGNDIHIQRGSSFVRSILIGYARALVRGIGKWRFHAFLCQTKHDIYIYIC